MKRLAEAQVKDISYMEYVEIMEKAVAESLDSSRVKKELFRKNNGVEKWGLRFLEPGKTASPVIYLEELYEIQKKAGYTIAEAVQAFLRTYQSVKEFPFPKEDFLWENVKERIVYRVINREWNEDMLKETPYTEVDSQKDFVMVFCIYLGQENSRERETATVLIKKAHLESWGVTEADVYQASIRNTRELCPPSFLSLKEMISGILMEDEKSAEISKDVLNENEMIVITNRQMCFGATVLFYPGMLEEIGDMLESDYFVLPSSTHETIIFKKEKGMQKEELSKMVASINKDMVDKSEWLSDCAYLYQRGSKTLV